jgi:hypothetical protein
MIRRSIARAARGALAAIALVLAFPAHAAAALDVQVKDVQTPAAVVRTTIEVRDLVPERFRKLMMEDGRVLHLRVQAELWESRPIWDRLVYPAIVRVFRLGRSPAGREVAITDPDGAATTYPAVPPAMPIVVDLGDRARVTSTEKYYVHVVATLGTLADRDADEVGDAVFGSDSETNSLGSLGRLMVKTAMKVSDYLQSVSAETRSRKLAGAEILRRLAP